MKLKVINKNGNEMAMGSGEDEAIAVFNHEYNDGDWIILDIDEPKMYYKIQLEDTMQESIVLIPGSFMTYYIPHKEKRSNYSPKSFYGDCHIIRASKATEQEIYGRRNLAFNPYDQHENETFFPHSTANIETRGECAFASRNAIDGFYFNDSHGSFPYQSWGINRDPQAMFKIDFKDEVEIDEVVFTLRADFPHDNYWNKVTLEFSDGSEIQCPLIKSAGRQSVGISPKISSYIVIKEMVLADNSSPFPALTQFEVWGRLIKKN